MISWLGLAAGVALAGQGILDAADGFPDLAFHLLHRPFGPIITHELLLAAPDPRHPVPSPWDGVEDKDTRYGRTVPSKMTGRSMRGVGAGAGHG